MNAKECVSSEIVGHVRVSFEVSLAVAKSHGHELNARESVNRSANRYMLTSPI